MLPSLVKTSKFITYVWRCTKGLKSNTKISNLSKKKKKKNLISPAEDSKVFSPGLKGSGLKVRNYCRWRWPLGSCIISLLKQHGCDYVPHHSSSCGSEYDLRKLLVQYPLLSVPCLDSTKDTEALNGVIGWQLSRLSGVFPLPTLWSEEEIKISAQCNNTVTSKLIAACDYRHPNVAESMNQYGELK